MVLFVRADCFQSDEHDLADCLCLHLNLFHYKCAYYFSLGKSFQQQREAMKQTIEEDKEPEKSGKCLLFVYVCIYTHIHTS